MKILIINCGSSSIKYQLLDMQNEGIIAKGNIERIGFDNSCLRLQHNKKTIEIKKYIAKHSDGIAFLLDFLTNGEFKVIDSLDEINAVGHRVVHGGEKFKKSVIINNDVIKGINDCAPIAPLHNPVNLDGILACMKLMPNTPQVAAFDTAFHQTIPEKAFLYGLPYELYTKYGVRRYGFHGISHQYVAQQVAQQMHKDLDKINLISCHLGNGASITAIKNGKSIDTSMGFTPLEGLIMGTRSGEIDPAIVPFIMDHEDMTAKQVYKYLNNKSGVLGISGLSSDFRDLESAAKQGDKRAKTALDTFTYQVQKYIGSYAASLDGLDAIVFTAGLGENSPYIRSSISKNLDYLNAYLDEGRNKHGEKTRKISTEESKVSMWVIPTNEELMIARETRQLCEGNVLYV